MPFLIQFQFFHPPHLTSLDEQHLSFPLPSRPAFISYHIFFRLVNFCSLFNFSENDEEKKMLQDLDHHHHYFLSFAALNSSLLRDFSLHPPPQFFFFPFFSSLIFILRDVRLFILLGSCHFSQFRLCLGDEDFPYISVYTLDIQTQPGVNDDDVKRSSLSLRVSSFSHKCLFGTRHDNAKSFSPLCVCIWCNNILIIFIIIVMVVPNNIYTHTRDDFEVCVFWLVTYF